MKLNLLVVGVFTIPALSWSQPVSGAFQSAFQLPGQIWNNNFAAMMDHNAGVFRVWWACGTGNRDGICYGYVDSNRNPSRNWLDNCSSLSHRPGGAFEPSKCISHFVNMDISASNVGMCDISDPTVVYFNAAYYMYVDGLATGSSGCPTEEGGDGSAYPGGIYVLTSADARNWHIQNGGNPVIYQPQYGTALQPSVVVMNYSYSCSSGTWSYASTSPYIKLFYVLHNNPTGYQPFPQPDPGYSMYAATSSDGVNFTFDSLTGQGQTGVPFGTNMTTNGWAPSVKKIGYHGDYPLVMSYTGPSRPVTAWTNGESEFYWVAGNNGQDFAFSPSGANGYLESDQTGTFRDTKGNNFISGNGYFNLWWSNAGSGQNAVYPYRGLGVASTLLPALPSLNCNYP